MRGRFRFIHTGVSGGRIDESGSFLFHNLVSFGVRGVPLTEGSIDRNLSFSRTSIIEIDEPCFSSLRAVEAVFVYARERIKCTHADAASFFFPLSLYLTFFTLSRANKLI